LSTEALRHPVTSKQLPEPQAGVLATLIRVKQNVFG
jgi:hypothetical protein